MQYSNSYAYGAAHELSVSKPTAPNETLRPWPNPTSSRLIRNRRRGIQLQPRIQRLVGQIGEIYDMDWTSFPSYPQKLTVCIMMTYGSGPREPGSRATSCSSTAYLYKVDACCTVIYLQLLSLLPRLCDSSHHRDTHGTGPGLFDRFFGRNGQTDVIQLLRCCRCCSELGCRCWRC